VWRIRTNQKLRELHTTPDLVADIKRRKLECLGHGIRMDGFYKVRQKVEENGKAQTEMPLEDAEDYLQEMKINKWRQKANNREERTFVVEVAKALTDCRITE
jgi:hypothetical protein